jgi:hypothetical protein
MIARLRAAIARLAARFTRAHPPHPAELNSSHPREAAGNGPVTAAPRVVGTRAPVPTSPAVSARVCARPDYALPNLPDGCPCGYLARWTARRPEAGAPCPRCEAPGPATRTRHADDTDTGTVTRIGTRNRSARVGVDVTRPTEQRFDRTGDRTDDATRPTAWGAGRPGPPQGHRGNRDYVTPSPPRPARRDTPTGTASGSRNDP